MDQVSVEGQAFHRAPQQVLLASSEINQESFREYARFRQSILTHQGSSTADDDAILNEEHRRKKNNEVSKLVYLVDRFQYKFHILSSFFEKMKIGKYVTIQKM